MDLSCEFRWLKVLSMGLMRMLFVCHIKVLNCIIFNERAIIRQTKNTIKNRSIKLLLLNLSVTIDNTLS